jgi:hypothetical protein
LLSWRRVATFLGERYEWAYFVAANLAVSIVGAGDFDRFMVWLAPVAILTLLVGDFSGGSPPRLCMHWLLLHVIAMEFFLPWFPDRDFYLSRYATHASGAGFAYIAVFSWVLIAVAVAIRVNEPPSRLTEATV